MTISGEWTCRLNRFGEEVAVVRLSLCIMGERVAGFFNGLKVEGSVTDSRLSLVVTRHGGGEWGLIEGLLNCDVIEGTVRRPGSVAWWRGERAPAGRPMALVHVFKPSTHPRLFSGELAPVLHVQPGDTIKTSLLDAGGWDELRVQRAGGGNPQTGPFFVQGALPGDTLVVRITEMGPNRATAVSSRRIVSSLLHSSYHKPYVAVEGSLSEWLLDLKEGTGRLATPPKRLETFSVKLDPVLGCVAVAPPARQSFSSTCLGEWGGNLDYNKVRAGVVIYIPVFQEGALLFLGDGHALQCDGEITGDALETSMDIECVVDLKRGSCSAGPRFEDSQTLMASGIAGSLHEALQQATTELLRWIERDYSMTSEEAQVVLGSLIRYDVAAVVNTQMHVVARIDKEALSVLGRVVSITS